MNTTGSGHCLDHATHDYDPQDGNEKDETVDTSQEQLPRLPSLFRLNYKEMLQLQDEEILQHLTSSDEHDNDDHDDMRATTILPNGERVLTYEHFVDRNVVVGCYDDLKHVDYHYIDYGYCGYVTGSDGHSSSGDRDNNNNHADIRHRFHPPLMLQQNKRVPGKGGFCWDAAFILGEYLIHCTLKQQPRQTPPLDTTSSDDSKITTTRMIELGCGTGICGMYLAKHLSSLPPTRTNQYHITLTDMAGPIQTLLQNNLRRNFQHYSKEEMEIFSEYFEQHQYPLLSPPSSLHCESNDEKKDTTCNKSRNSSNETAMIEAVVLDWDDYYKTKQTSASEKDTVNTTPQQPQHSETYDIVFGSDIVASIYDPIQLAYTIYYLCHAQSVVYLSYKERLSRIHVIFQNAMTEMFQHVRIFNTSTGTTILDINTNIIHADAAGTIVDNSNDEGIDFTSRNGNPNVYIVIASHPKPKSTWRTVDLVTERSECNNNYK